MAALTVLLPVFNGEAYLDQAITSIRQQTFPDFEFLIVDDGSTDRSGAIAAQHASEDPRIRVLANPGKGLIDGLNFGIAQASTPLIARMDADDIAMPERFARQAARMAAEPDLLVLGTGSIRIDAAGNRRETVTPPTEMSEIAAALERVNVIAHPTVTMRRAAVQAVGGYRAAYVRGEDYDLWLRLAERGRLANLAEPLIEYRIVAGFRPDVFARQILSEMTARAAAKLRRSGQPDPTGEWQDIDAAKLASIGIDPTDVEREVARRALHAARLCRKMRDKIGFRAALDLADSQPRPGFRQAMQYAVRRLRASL